MKRIILSFVVFTIIGLSLPAFSQSVGVTLNPNRFGDYFEQIEASDALTQPLLIYNNISSLPKDSLSGSLSFLAIKLTYSDGFKVIQKDFELSPMNSMND
jgi:hypothetical protein